jgi:hypothetical protein
MKYPILALLAIALFLGSCQGEESPLDQVPRLRVESITPRTVRQFQDSIQLVLSYEDANGDLGSEDPDERVLSVKDSRLDIPDYYHVKPLAPPGTEVAIQGTFQVKLRSAFLLGNGDSEQIAFTIQITDRAGNRSEPVVSPTITVVK